MKRVTRLSILLCVMVPLLILALILGTSCSSGTTTSAPPPKTTAAPPASTTAPPPATTSAAPKPSTTSPPPSSSAAPAVIKLTFASWSPPANAESVACEKWARDFEQKTNGRYKVEVVHGGVIANPGKSYDAIVNGIADIASFVPKESDKPFPIVTMSTLPVGFVTCETGYQAWFKLFQEGYFDKELSAIKPLFTFIGNNEDVSTKKPINSVAEFKGLKLVVPGGIQVDITKAVGAVPVTGGPPDAYELVQKGVADGIFIAGLGFQEFQWADLVKYLIRPMQFGKASHVIGMNKDVYNKMPADVKAIVDGMVADPQYGLMVAKGWDQWYNGSVKYFYDKGGKDVNWSPEELAKLGAIIQPMWADWVKKNEASGSTKALTAYYNYMKAAGVQDPTPGWKP